MTQESNYKSSTSWYVPKLRYRPNTTKIKISSTFVKSRRRNSIHKLCIYRSDDDTYSKTISELCGSVVK